MAGCSLKTIETGVRQVRPGKVYASEVEESISMVLHRRTHSRDSYGGRNRGPQKEPAATIAVAKNTVRMHTGYPLDATIPAGTAGRRLHRA